MRSGETSEDIAADQAQDMARDPVGDPLGDAEVNTSEVTDNNKNMGILQRQAARRQRRASKLRPRIGLRLGIFLFFMFGAIAALGYLASGRSLQLPGWMVAELEHRLNQRLVGSHLPPGAAIEIGGVELGASPELTPMLYLRELQLIEPNGNSLLALPSVKLSVAPLPLLIGQVRPTGLRLSGARIALARDIDGRIALSFGGLSGAPELQSPAEILDNLDRMFATPFLAQLRMIEADGLTFALDDARAERRWDLGDGRLNVENREDALHAELGLTLLSGGTPAQVKVTLETSKADSAARLWVKLDNMSAGDLALQAAPLTALSVIEAPISGELLAELDAKGDFGKMSGELTLGEGWLNPASLSPEGVSPKESEGDIAPGVAVNGAVAFDRSSVQLSYNPLTQRVTLNALTVESDTLRIKASGTADLLNAEGQPVQPGELPKQLVSQLAFSDVMVDPEGLFEVPARFSEGSASYRLNFAPFRLDLGDAMLAEGDEKIELRGYALFDETQAEGARWDASVDVGLNRISADRLIQLWPVSAVPKTRKWLAENVGQGVLTDVAAALRLRPGRAPRFALDYQFSGAEVRFIRTLPPVSHGRGRANILDNVYTLVLEGGHVTAPVGGQIDVEGSVFQVLDITQKPAQAEVRLLTKAGLEATLSLLDQEPFRFISKAGRKPDIGTGTALLEANMRFPLVQKLKAKDVFFDVTGKVYDFSSDKIAPGRVMTSPALDLHVTPREMNISGDGALSGVPIQAKFTQALGPESGGRAEASGKVQLSDANLRKLGVVLPQGWISGSAPADVKLDIRKGAPVALQLNSKLVGLSLAVPPLGYRKAPGSSGSLSLSAVLSEVPKVTGFKLEAPGFGAEGQISLHKGAGLDRLTLTRLRVGDWLNTMGEVIGKGQGKMPEIKLTGGSLDLRGFPSTSGGAGAGGTRGRGPEIALGLDRLIVTDSVSLTGVSGAFIQRDGGLDGRFVAAVNGVGRIQGATVPHKGGTAVRITAQDAGRVMAAAGIFDKGRDGTLDMTLQPTGVAGSYQGSAKFTNLSVQNAPVLASLLSAASGVGLIEQMQGQGLFFNEGDLNFDVSKSGVEIRQGAAVGASMGISFEGLYNARTQTVDIQGTISPFYILNGIGQIFTRPGEGLFGFSYRLTGAAKSPQVSVNPLSILTPGMFRDIFRRPAPKLRSQG